ncbi:MAG TPA: excisionase family DNA-binding protein [Chitinophagaceae bacterium]|jgi:excisionase family DNA binding protein|nr:excisionase family DNA-binding protein [Chitinophagaceae bacterium]
MPTNKQPVSLERFADAINLIFDRFDALEAKIGIKPPESANEKPITSRELCEYLGISEPTLIRMKKKGQVPFFSPGGTAVRYYLSAVMKALEKKPK